MTARRPIVNVSGSLSELPAADTLAGDLNGTVGSTTPAAGAFTSLTATNDAIINSLTIGLGAGNVATNTAFGLSSLSQNTTGSNNAALGYGTLSSNKTGHYNLAFGTYALLNNSTGQRNVAIGWQSMATTYTASYNTAIGGAALFYNSCGGSNTALGYTALYDLKPTSKAISAFSDYSGTVAGTVKATSVGHGLTGTTTKTISGGTPYDGAKSITVIDADSFYFTAAWSTTATGWWAIVTESNNNTALGANAGKGITTGSGNTVIGANVTGLSADLTNNIIIANGTGAIKAQHDGTDWTLTGKVAGAFNGTLGATTPATASVTTLGVAGDITLDGQATRTTTVARNTTSNTAGNHLYIYGGGATVGATNKAGGYVAIRGGQSTGTGESSIYLQGCPAGSSGTGDNAYVNCFQITGAKIGLFGVTPVARPTALTASVAAAPAGGTGTAAGGWDTAAHRDTAITLINNLKTRLDELESKLQALGLLT